MDQDSWWKFSVGYEVYVRSFADSNADGVGDLAGITTKLDYLAALGVDLIWLTPFYPSPFADFGYDVSDYTDVDPLFGNLDDFDELVTQAHQRDLKVVVDIVPNHSSEAHSWFRESRKGSMVDGAPNPFRDYYIWADPAPDGGYPNNWIGYFGGPAWTFDEASGQYYLHLFLPEQPDLNWANPAVLDAFDNVLRFWLDRGADGFRIDVAQALAKDQLFRSNPELYPWDPGGLRWEQWDAFDHKYDILQPEALAIFERWNQVVKPYDALLLGETYVLDPIKLNGLLPGDGIHAGFWFQSMHMKWNAQDIRACIDSPMEAVDDPSMVGWVAASHDEVRPPSRFGGGDAGRQRSLALSTILFGLPGLPVLYQGEELGLTEGVVPNHLRADPVGEDVTQSRDGCRTPMPWTPDGPSMGFSEAESTWLPMGGRTEQDAASVQQTDSNSWFSAYARLIAARKDNPQLVSAAFAWLDLGDDIVAYQRGNLIVAANTGEQSREIEGEGVVVFSTQGHTGSVINPVLAPAEALFLRLND